MGAFVKLSVSVIMLVWFVSSSAEDIPEWAQLISLALVCAGFIVHREE